MEQAEAQQEQGAKERLRHAEFYRDLYREAESLVSGEDDLIANTANIASLVYHALNERQSNTTNWVGFYFVRSSETKGEELVLGPFQGKVACIRIAKGKGVCGMCWNTKQGIVVPDVHKFEGHIACDSASESEIVLPIIDPSTGVNFPSFLFISIILSCRFFSSLFLTGECCCLLWMECKGSERSV
ncbi:GAF domain-containing protein, variant 2 [Balamuthia mandrillaris]